MDEDAIRSVTVIGGRPNLDFSEIVLIHILPGFANWLTSTSAIPYMFNARMLKLIINVAIQISAEIMNDEWH